MEMNTIAAAVKDSGAIDVTFEDRTRVGNNSAGVQGDNSSETCTIRSTGNRFHGHATIENGGDDNNLRECNGDKYIHRN